MKFIEKIVELLSAVRIALSPILLFTIIGTLFYFYSENYGLLLLVGFIVLGLIVGIILAMRISKRKGATNFISKLSATPELDNKE